MKAKLTPMQLDPNISLFDRINEDTEVNITMEVYKMAVLRGIVWACKHPWYERLLPFIPCACEEILVWEDTNQQLDNIDLTHAFFHLDAIGIPIRLKMGFTSAPGFPAYGTLTGVNDKFVDVEGCDGESYLITRIQVIEMYEPVCDGVKMVKAYDTNN